MRLEKKIDNAHFLQQLKLLKMSVRKLHCFAMQNNIKINNKIVAYPTLVRWLETGRFLNKRQEKILNLIFRYIKID